MFAVINPEGRPFKKNLTQADVVWWKRHIPRFPEWRGYQVVKRGDNTPPRPIYDPDTLSKIFEKNICYHCGEDKPRKLKTGWLPMTKAAVWFCPDCSEIYHAEKGNEAQWLKSS